MIFIDSNIPMYLVGADHPHKQRSEELLRHFVTARERLVTDVEVFQEMLHRYTAIRRRQMIEPGWQTLAGLVDDVFAVELNHVEKAKGLCLEHDSLSARDALHVAVMVAHEIEQILTFDTGFDSVPGIQRIY